MKSRPILYIKTGCPWCCDALSYFERQSVDLDIKDVLQDQKAASRMKEISGQTKTPTLEYADFMVADFSVDEFVAAARKRPDIQEKLGLKD